jgi:hypothetical protein
VGYDLLAAIFFVAITPVVIAGFVIFWIVNARDHEELARAWRGYAAKRGLAFVEPTGEWPNRTPPAMTWTDGSSELRLSALGREATVRTRLTVRPRSALLGVLTVVIAEGGAGTIAMRERPNGFSQRLLTPHVERVLRGFRQRDRITFSYRRGRVILEWPGGEQNDARLDEARRVGAEIARAIEDEFVATAAVRKPAA